MRPSDIELEQSSTNRNRGDVDLTGPRRASFFGRMIAKGVKLPVDRDLSSRSLTAPKRVKSHTTWVLTGSENVLKVQPSEFGLAVA